ncbi:MAG: 30S ribosomal protein S9 [Planctomycetota bacterium]|jgi:small subunit ribosomal protein S9
MAKIKVDNPDTKEAVLDLESRPKPAPNPASEPKGGYWWGTGRRKSSVARVRIKPGSGKFIVNKKKLDDYFTRAQDRKAVLAPLKTVDAEKAFDVFINVKGGGTTGQSGASLLGIARALKKYDVNYLQALRDGGHLTRDPRMVERKKPGQRGARRRFQFSKR